MIEPDVALGDVLESDVVGVGEFAVVGTDVADVEGGVVDVCGDVEVGEVVEVGVVDVEGAGRIELIAGN